MFFKIFFNFLVFFNIFVFSQTIHFKEFQQLDSVKVELIKSQYYIVNQNKIVVLKNNNLNTFVPQLQNKLLKIYGQPFTGENGKLIVQIIIKPSVGKVSSYLIYKNEGNKLFEKHVRIFLKKLLKEKILYSIDGKIYQFKFLILVKSSKNIGNNIKNYLLFGKNKYIENPYDYYIYYLIIYKKYSKKFIKKILNSPDVSITKAMLYYLYFNYKKPNKKYALHYFNVLINNSERIQGKIESLFLSDELLKKEEYFKILELLPENFCNMIEDFKLRNACNYYQGIAKYMNDYDDFLINLRQAQSIPTDRKFLKQIGY